DAAAQPQYLMADGVAINTAAYGRIAGPVQALVNQVRAMPPALSGPRSVFDYAVVEGIPAIVGVMTVTSDTGAILLQPGTEPLIAVVQFLDRDAAAQFSREYLFEDGHF